jgi:hypothetical protein
MRIRLTLSAAQVNKLYHDQLREEGGEGGDNAMHELENCEFRLQLSWKGGGDEWVFQL